MYPRNGWQIRGSVGDRLNSRFLIVGDDRDLGVSLDLSLLVVGTQHGDFLINAQDLRHLWLEVLIALFKVVAHFMWFHVLVGQDLADSALRDLRQARVARLWPVLAGMPGQ